MSSEPAARRIMNEFGEETRIPFLNIAEGDISVVVVFPILALVVMALAGLDSLTLPAAAGGLGLGLAIVYVTPSHMTATEWLSAVTTYAQRPDVTFNSPADDEQAPENEGGLLGRTPFSPDERTQDLTEIDVAWPGAGTVQRQDGAMEAFIEVDPDNMDFAMSSDWAALQSTAAEYANKELDHRLTFYATTKSFPIEKLVERIDDRLECEDVRQNEIFRELLEEYREKRPEKMRDRGTKQMRYFVGVEVSRLEVYNRYSDSKTPAEKLTDIPIVGFLFNSLLTRREDFTEEELRREMLKKLDERIEAVETNLIQNADGWSSRRLSTVELFLLNMEFWNGEEADYGDLDDAVGTAPAMGRRERGGDDAAE